MVTPDITGIEKTIAEIFAVMRAEAVRRIEESYRNEGEFVRIRSELSRAETSLSEQLRTLRHKQTELERVGWRLLCIFPEPGKPLVAKAMIGRGFNVKGTEGKPIVLINDVPCGYQVVDRDGGLLNVEINLRPVLGTSPESLKGRVKQCEEFPTFSDLGVEIPNPYLIKKEWFQASTCVWQCQGHKHEKLIMIKPATGSVWNQAPGVSCPVLAEFDLLSNGRKLDTFNGLFLWNGALSIKIPSIQKEDCVGKNVELRLSHAPGIKLILPSPSVVSVNGELVV